jgi:hypothetical protein
MSTADQGAASGSLTRDQVLDELDFLGTVEHALLVEDLTIFCALGCDLDADDGGPTTDQARTAAQAASSLALGEMFRLKNVSLALAAAGRSADLDRAASITDASGASISLDPPGLAQLQQLTAREPAIAAAVDARYAKLLPSVTTDPVFDGELLSQMELLVEGGSTHADGLSDLMTALNGLNPADYLRATRRETTDAFEERLLGVSDGCYKLVIGLLQEQFGQGSGFSSLALNAMQTLDAINHALAERGLLPPFKTI